MSELSGLTTVQPLVLVVGGHSHVCIFVVNVPPSALQLTKNKNADEGFGLHLVNVQSSKTTGGIGVSTLEEHFAKRLGDLSSFDAVSTRSNLLVTGARTATKH